MSDKLTDKQRKFCIEYLKHWNATKAAIVAGYSKKTAYAIGNENLKKLEIQKFIKEAQEDIQKIANISILSQLEELKEILGSKEENTRDRIRAIEVINKMLGYNAPEQYDHTSNGKEISISPINWIDGNKPE